MQTDYYISLSRDEREFLAWKYFNKDDDNYSFVKKRTVIKK